MSAYPTSPIDRLVGTSTADILIFAGVIGMLVVRPSGLLGKVHVTRV